MARCEGQLGTELALKVNTSLGKKNLLSWKESQFHLRCGREQRDFVNLLIEKFFSETGHEETSLAVQWLRLGLPM